MTLSIVKDPPPDTEGDAVSKLFEIFSAARAARAGLVQFNTRGIYGGALVLVSIEHHPKALYAAELYAGGNGLELKPDAYLYDDGTQSRVVRMSDQHGVFAEIQWPIEQQPVKTTPADDAWRPTDTVSP